MKRRLRYGDNQKGVRTAIGLGLALILAACGGDASDDGVEEPTTVVTEAPTTTTTTTTAPPAEPDPPPEPLPSILDESFIAETAAAADVVGGSAFVFAVLDADGNILQGVKGTDDDDNFT